MRRRMRFASKTCLAGLIITGLLAVSACGRKGPPVPPEGEEANYSYPVFYPSQEETLEPRRSDEPGLEDSTRPPEEVEGEVSSEAARGSDYGPLLKPPRAGYRFEGDGYSRSRSLSY